MEAALPIYDGHRVRAIKLAKMAAREIREAAAGARGVGTVGAPRMPASQRAAQVPKGREKGLSRYNAQQVQDSNALMQEGIQLLQQGLQQVRTIGNDQGNHMGDAAEFGSYAIQSVNAGLQFAAGRVR